jgi:hypothetical protein
MADTTRPETHSQGQAQRESAPAAKVGANSTVLFLSGLVVVEFVVLLAVWFAMSKKPTMQAPSALEESIVEIDLGDFSRFIESASPMAPQDELSMKVNARLNAKMDDVEGLKAKLNARIPQFRDRIFKILYQMPVADHRSNTLLEYLQVQKLAEFNGIVGKTPEGESVFVLIFMSEFRPPRRGS